MTPKLYGHPFSSYTWKALTGLYEAEVAFEMVVLSPDAPDAGARLHALWPLGRFPVLEVDGRALIESSVIVEWADQRRIKGSPLLPTDPDLALEVRMLDRIFDTLVMTPVQGVVGDRLRPDGSADPFGVEQAHATLDRIYAWLNARLDGREWAAGPDFSLADISAAPSLFYADWVHPLAGHAHLAAYLRRLRARPSVARCVEGARPFRQVFPGGVPAHAGLRVARPAGLEPATARLEGECSIRLS